MNKYALIEFESSKHELEIVSISTLRSVEPTSTLPCNGICDWKAKGSKKMKSYSVLILNIAGKTVE